MSKGGKGGVCKYYWSIENMGMNERKRAQMIFHGT